jgi:glutaminyl-peptide cyclotransferase
MPNVPRVSLRRESIVSSAVVLLAVLLVACGDGGTGSAPNDRSDGFDEARAFADVETMVGFGPRPAGSPANARQARFLADELEQAGVEDVAIGSPYANVTGVIPGRDDGYVVLGAHHDTKDDVPGLVGANDGASGVAVVLELARTLPNPMPGPGLAIALFDAEETRGDRPFEEDGMRGSRDYVATAEGGGDPRAGIPALNDIRAMVLLDMIGDCDLQIPREFSSDEELYDAFAEAAGGAPFEGTTGPILDDHVPFLEAGVPAVDFIDFTYGGDDQPGTYWHTPEDTLDKVCPESLDVVGETALIALPGIR